MIRKIVQIVALTCLPMFVMAQTPETKIAITPYVCDEIEIPMEAHNTLDKKLLQIASQNDFASQSGEFVLTVNTLILDRLTTATIPAQHVVDMELSFYVVNVMEKVIVAEQTLSIRGMGRTEAKAYIGAINRVNPRSPQMRQFMQTAREKIVDYYITRVPVLIAKAQSLTARADYKGALAVLGTIPECVEEYPMVAERMTKVYIQMVDKYAAVSIQEAKTKLAREDWDGALESLLYVDPMSTRFDEATQMIDRIRDNLNPDRIAEMEAKIKELETEIATLNEEQLKERQLTEAQHKAYEIAAEETDTIELEKQIMNIIK